MRDQNQTKILLMLIDFVSWVNNCVMKIYAIKNKMKTIKKNKRKKLQS